MTPQETDPDLPVSVQEPPVEVWVCGGLLQCFRGTESRSVKWDRKSISSFEGEEGLGALR